MCLERHTDVLVSGGEALELWMDEIGTVLLEPRARVLSGYQKLIGRASNRGQCRGRGQAGDGFGGMVVGAG